MSEENPSSDQNGSVQVRERESLSSVEYFRQLSERIQSLREEQQELLNQAAKLDAHDKKTLWGRLTAAIAVP